MSKPWRSATVGTGKTWVVPKHLPEALVLAEVEGPVAAIVQTRQDHRAAIGEAELVAHEGGNAAGLSDGTTIEEVPGVEGGVADERKSRAVDLGSAGLGDDVREGGGALADLRRHYPGIRPNLLDGFDVEV